MKPTRVLCFGDSVVQGCWDSEGGWVDRLKRQYHMLYQTSGVATKVQVFNLGIGGEASTQLLKRLPAEIEARLWLDWELAFVFSVCTNDVRTVDGVTESSIEQLVANTQQIIIAAQNYSSRILFVGPPPLAASQITFKHRMFDDTNVLAYELAQQQVVQAAGLPYIRTRPVFEQAQTALHVADGVHPNDAGHELIAKVVEPELRNLLT